MSLYARRVATFDSVILTIHNDNLLRFLCMPKSRSVPCVESCVTRLSLLNNFAL